MVDHLLKGTPDGIINRGFKSELFGGHMQARFYAGARGPSPPSPPQFVAAPIFLKVFPFFITDIVFVMT